MFITGEALHKPMPGVIVSVDDIVDETETGSGVEGSVPMVPGSGVHVAGSPNGVATGICRAGPRGFCHNPRYSHTTRPNKQAAMTERKVREAF
jgi:hypothetical protein